MSSCGVVHERLDQADLLPVALGQPAEWPGQIQLQPLGQPVDAGGRHPAAQVAEEDQQLPGGLAAAQGQLAGQVADATAQPGAAGARILAQHPHGAGGGPQQVQQQPDGGGLAGPVGAQVPEHLPGLDCQVQPLQRRVPAVALDQPLGQDHPICHHVLLCCFVALRSYSSCPSSRYRWLMRRMAAPARVAAGGR
jgi:hypothetical protein